MPTRDAGQLRDGVPAWLTRIGINEAYGRIRPSPIESLDIDDGFGSRVAGSGDQPNRVFESPQTPPKSSG